tara:strand:+ start:2334 stop:2636 length:303 start_codon:yes stop_codon:yes gene_type:complete
MSLKEFNGLKNVEVSEGRAQMTFCANCKSCPAIDISAESDTVVVGGDEEGYTSFTKEQFKLFADVVKSGAFDKYMAKKCACGKTQDPDGNCDGSHADKCE